MAMEDIFTQLKNIKNPPGHQDRPKTQAAFKMATVHHTLPVLPPMTPPCQVGSYDSFPTQPVSPMHESSRKEKNKKPETDLFMDLKNVIRKANASSLDISKDEQPLNITEMEMSPRMRKTQKIKQI